MKLKVLTDHSDVKLSRSVLDRRLMESFIFQTSCLLTLSPTRVVKTLIVETLAEQNLILVRFFNKCVSITGNDGKSQEEVKPSSGKYNHRAL